MGSDVFCLILPVRDSDALDTFGTEVQINNNASFRMVKGMNPFPSANVHFARSFGEDGASLESSRDLLLGICVASLAKSCSAAKWCPKVSQINIR